MTEQSTDSYVRVTSVLWPFSDLHSVPPAILDKAAKRGTAVHTVCEAIACGIGEFGVTKEIAPYVESFNHWWGEGKKVLALEQRFFCDKYRFTGQIDLIIEEPEGVVIVDIKTSSKTSKTWRAQGSAYCYLAQQAGYDVKRVVFLHLSKNAKPPKEIEYAPDPEFFLGVLNTYNHFYKGSKHEQPGREESSQIRRVEQSQESPHGSQEGREGGSRNLCPA